MSHRDDDSVRGEAIWETVERAREAMTQYIHTVNSVAASGEVPDDNPDVQSALVRLHTAVIAAHSKLRPYLKDDEEFWEEVTLHEGEAIQGVQVFDEFDAVYTTERTERTDHQGHTATETYAQPILLPHEAYINAVHVFGEAADAFGFAPPADDREPQEAEGKYAFEGPPKPFENGETV